jgi:hypothetical protein
VLHHLRKSVDFLNSTGEPYLLSTPLIQQPGWFSLGVASNNGHYRELELRLITSLYLHQMLMSVHLVHTIVSNSVKILLAHISASVAMATLCQVTTGLAMTLMSVWVIVTDVIKFAQTLMGPMPAHVSIGLHCKVICRHAYPIQPHHLSFQQHIPTLSLPRHL